MAYASSDVDICGEFNSAQCERSRIIECTILISSGHNMFYAYKTWYFSHLLREINLM